jgi:hypothetical protein
MFVNNRDTADELKIFLLPAHNIFYCFRLICRFLLLARRKTERLGFHLQPLNLRKKKMVGGTVGAQLAVLRRIL